MSTGTNGDGVSPANGVVLDRSYPRIVVMERVEMPTAQPALLAGTKAAGATTDVRVASPVLSSIVFRRSTAQLPLMLSVGTVCPGAFQLSLVEADTPTVPPQEATLVALEVCCSLRLIKQQRRNLSSPCHPARRPVLSPKSLGPLAALPSCSLWTLFLYHNSSRGLKCDVHKS
ncbi:tumor necrosis factor receptor superfamily member 27 isoform X26 [Homo sapiens]|uniref:tumor necrosis factor receptor superfamily member 27 isoform X26 n=1 Tax=Homo sapiens TaxID=9606 RepID=UPI001FB0A196|nr:tumor necrosis factor receptor superfamily member 27 isoform X26 [Homo sapiens]